jgi:hypothetical protein
MKYANNTFGDMTNSVSRVVYVDGIKHICLYASCHIDVGDEILFDYGYDAEKQDEIFWMN